MAKRVECVEAFQRAEAEALSRPNALEPLLERDSVFLNHGGLGGPPRAIIELRRVAERLCERQPMRWCRDDGPQLMARARAAVATYLGIADPTRLVFVNNASAAIFAVLEALALAPGDVVVAGECVYHSVGDALRHLCARAGAVIEVVPLLPHGATAVSDEAELQDAWEAGVEAAARRAAAAGGRVKLAVLDHISSKPSVVFPVAGMVALCARHGVPTLVDGAHAPGSMREADMQLDRLGADFYAMNFHKWMHAPRPCAGLYVRYAGLQRPKHASGEDTTDVHPRWPWIDYSRLTPQVPPPGPPPLSAEASYVTDVLTLGHYDESTRDYAHFVVLPACVALARRLEARTLQHRAQMLVFTARAVREACYGGAGAVAGAGASTIAQAGLVPPALCVSMATVRLPTAAVVRALLRRRPDLAPKGADSVLAHGAKWAKKALHRCLLIDFNIEVPVLVFRDELYLRVSLPLHVGRQEVTVLANALSSLLEATGSSPGARAATSKL